MSLSDHLFRGRVLGGSVVDHLASQGSLAYEREKGQLIAVNAGSNYDHRARWPEFLTTPRQVAFTPEGGKLLVTTKGNTGAIEVFDVNALGGASLHPVVTSPPGAVRFAATVDYVGNVAVTETGPSALSTSPPSSRAPA
jgi:hypothetical protein